MFYRLQSKVVNITDETRMQKVAIYPGTFDPITLGHEDIIKRALGVFGQVVVAVACVNDDKKTLFSLEQRVALATDLFSANQNVSVVSFSGLLVDYAKNANINVIIRGLRNAADFDYEFTMSGMNQQLRPDIETIFLRSADHYCAISSSLIKEIAKHGGDVSAFVSPAVQSAFLAHFNR